MVSALEGITVVDISWGMAGALAAMFLCDNGARVIRIDAPGSDHLRNGPGYAVWDRGKESVVLDLFGSVARHQQTGRAPSWPDNPSGDLKAFYRLVDGADILIDSCAPSSPFQSLIDYGRLSFTNPGLVHCSITAYGRQGPLKDEPPVDDLVMARIGLLADQPGFRRGPVHLVHPFPSVGAGLLAALGIVTSLFARERTGRGRKVDTSLMAGALLYAPKVAGDRMNFRPFQYVPAGGGPFYSVFECADGQWVQLGCVHSGFIEVAAAVMDLVDVIADPKYGEGRLPVSEKARRELFDIVAGVIKARPYDEWAKVFEEADVPYARSCTVEEAMDDHQVRFNEMVIELDDPEVGPMLQMGLPFELSKTPGTVKGPRPTPGQHTAAALSGQALQSNTPSGSSPETMDPPLKGTKVLDITNVIAGPAATRLLADLGAEVVKLEPPDGEISRLIGRAYFVYLNSSKRGISVDTHTPEGREIVQKLAAQADILVANLRPGATERMGIGTEMLKKLNPRLIETHVTAFGWTGPYAHRPGLDPLAQALMGLQRAQGGPHNPPVFLSELAPTDFTAGALGALGAVMALFVRERTGLAQRVDTNLLNGGIVLSSEEFVRYAGKPTRRLPDKGQYGIGALHRLYETADGWIYLIAETQEEWRALCRALGHDDLLRDGRYASLEARRDNDEALAHELAQVFASAPTEDWLRRLKQAGVLCAPVVEEYKQGFFSDPHAIANDMMVALQHSDLGPLKLSRNLVKFGGTAETEARPVPLLGQHTRELLHELAYSQRQIEELYRKGVVKTEGPSQES